MRIWFINHYALSPESAGGTRHYDQAVQLAALGHEVTIIASSFNHWTKRDEHCREGESFRFSKHGDVSFLWLKTPAYRGSVGRLFNMLIFSRRVKSGVGSETLEKPDVIIGSSPHLFGAMAALVLARKLRVPFLAEIRDLWPQTLLDLGNISSWHPLVKIMARQERILYREADHILALMPGAVSYINQVGNIDEEKVTWLPNGVAVDQVPCDAATESKQLKVIYAGSHGVANGLDSVIMTISLLEKEELGDRFRFLFYGDGPEKERLQQMATDLSLTSIAFHAPTPKVDVYNVLQVADLFIVTLKDSPLYKYGMSLNKLYDYMAMARPVVFGGKSLNNPVAETGAGIVVPAEDSAAMADALKQLAALSVEERNEMGRKGRAFVAEIHDVKKLALTLERVCEKVTGS
ncbi:glycosyltransferase family 4 protein [Deltaproteobacteria bacterium IMCC39524]|nr:glycosyltransferase family 4 protein [Deltaproteobacteria bacterium IMCC39524]